jgi:hypothetical protein
LTTEQGIRTERESDYGPFRQHWEATGHAWWGILRQMGWKAPEGCTHIQPRHVGLFFAADKLMREAYRHKADNVHDGRNYLEMAGEAAEDCGPFRVPVEGAGPVAEDHCALGCGCRVGRVTPCEGHWV